MPEDKSTELLEYTVKEGRHRDKDGTLYLTGDKILLTEAEADSFVNKFAPVMQQVTAENENSEDPEKGSE